MFFLGILLSYGLTNFQQHPNEYIRGASLRFLQKIAKDSELLEPLIPTCRACLEHRHSYVRKNAIFALYSIYREFEHLIPDAAELMFAFLAAEADSSCKRNAFVFLAHCSMPKAVEYIMNIYDTIGSLDEALQMSLIEVIRLDCKNDSSHRVSAHHRAYMCLRSIIPRRGICAVYSTFSMRPLMP